MLDSIVDIYVDWMKGDALAEGFVVENFPDSVCTSSKLMNLYIATFRVSQRQSLLLWPMVDSHHVYCLRSKIHRNVYRIQLLLGSVTDNRHRCK